MLQIFKAINAGAGLGLATPFTTAACLFFLENDCVYLDAECLYDHINWEKFQTCALRRLRARCELNERGKDTVLIACTLHIHAQTVLGRAVACIISYQTAKETMFMQCRSYAFS